MNRRTFIKTSATVGVAAMAYPSFAEKKEAGKTQLKLCSQISKITGKTFAEKIKKIEDWGGLGVELHGNPKTDLAEYTKVLADSTVAVSALCWGACKGKLVNPDKKLQQEGVDALKSALETAGKLKANGVIFVPCFNKDSKLKPDELDKILLEVLPGLADFAASHNTNVLIEPLRKGETFYINRLEQAVKICKQVNKPGLAIMGDFYHMTREEKNEREAFTLAGDLLKHVHIASRKTRKMPGTDEDNYVDGLGGLKAIGYHQYISLECGFPKGKDKDESVQSAFKLLQEQWDKATA